MEMSPEGLAEWRKFAQESIPAISRLSDASEQERVLVTTMLSAILELIDALTAERERAERAEIMVEGMRKALNIAVGISR